jgi:hypothetical protein
MSWTFPQVPYDTWVRYLQEMGTHVREIVYDVDSRDTKMNSLVLRVAQYCVALERFRVSSYRTADAHIAVLISACHQLTEISLQQLSMTNLVVLTTFCPRLRVLESSIDAGPGSAEELSAIGTLTDLRKLNLTCNSAHPQFHSAITAVASSCQLLIHVSLKPLTVEGAMVFVTHCQGMQHFESTLDDAVATSLLDAIAASWQDLRQLLLWSDAHTSFWSDAHDSAVVNLIKHVPSLTHLVCFIRKEMWFLRRHLVHRSCDLWYLFPPIVPVPSALRLLWVTQLSLSAMNAVISHCPALKDVAHAAKADPPVLNALAASNVKTVNFPGTGVHADMLDPFDDLHGLQMWNIEEKREEALEALAERSPALKVLKLQFNKRPPFRFIPDVLQHTRGLEALYVGIVEPAEESSDSSDSEEEDSGLAARQAMAEAMEAVAQVICPLLTDVGVEF